LLDYLVVAKTSTIHELDVRCGLLAVALWLRLRAAAVLSRSFIPRKSFPPTTLAILLWIQTPKL
jgi:hypothetical protein